MKVVALISGGKDSLYNIHKCIQHGHTIVALANLCPLDTNTDELDSHCFQTVGHQLIKDVAACMQLPLYQQYIHPDTSINTQLQYTTTTDADEVEQLYKLLQIVIRHHPDVTGVSSGAILSNYQRLRVENVCQRLGLTSLAYLWQYDQSILLQQMIDAGFHAVLIKVASAGLNATKHCNKSLADIQSHLLATNKSHGVNVCGEGGEYESLVLDCPLYKQQRLVIDKYDIHTESTDASTGDTAGYMKISKWHMESKADASSAGLTEQVKQMHIDEPAPPQQTYQPHAEEDITDTVVQPEPDTDNRQSIATTSGETSLATSPMMPDTDSIMLSAPSDTTTTVKRHKSHQPHTITPESLLEIHKLASSYASADYVFILSALAAHTESTLTEQLDTCIHNITTELQHHGAQVSDVYYTNVIITDMNAFTHVNAVYSEFFSSFNAASRACLQLTLPDYANVQIECCVNKSSHRSVLHVQSISEWAPACIGPYSQATTIDNVIFMAGQIGLHPPTMQLPPDVAAQALNAIANCTAVLQATQSDVQHVISTVVFVADDELDDSSFNTVKQLIDDSSINNQTHTPLVFSIPSMPRDALAEIQLIAVEKHTPIPEFIKYPPVHLAPPADDYELLVYSTYLTGHYCSAWFTVHCNMSMDVVEQIPFTMTEHIVKAAAQCAQDAGLNTLDLISSRMYHVDALDTERLDSDICGAWASFFDSQLVVAPYQVTSIYNNDEMMVALHLTFLRSPSRDDVDDIEYDDDSERK